MENSKKLEAERLSSKKYLTNATGSSHPVGIFIVSENRCDSEFQDVMNSAGPIVIYPNK